MNVKAKSWRIARWAAIGSALTAVATLGVSGTANAAYSSPPASTTDWFALDLVNNPGLQHFEVCDDQSTSNRIFVGVEDVDLGGARLPLTDAANGNTTYGEYVNFNPGGCEGWWVDNAGSDTLQGVIWTPTSYATPPVHYN